MKHSSRYLIGVFTSATLLLQVPAMAQDKKASNTRLSVQEFLSKVQESSTYLRSLKNEIQSLELRLNEKDLEVSPEAFATWGISDDKTPPGNPFMSPRTEVRGWTAGIRQKTILGLTGSISMSANQTLLDGIDPNNTDFTDFSTTNAAIQLELPLLRNAFGQATRSELRMGRMGIEAELNQKKYELKTALLNAENLYWTLASLDQIIDLQKENKERAETTAKLMARKARQNLVDDVDSLQAQAAVESRALDLERSTDSHRSAKYQFCLLLGCDDNTTLTLEVFPEDKWQEKIAQLPSTPMPREDFTARRLSGELTQEQGNVAVSNLLPELNLVGSYGINGREPDFDSSQEEMNKGEFPAWTIGLKASVPLDFGLLSKTRSGYQAKREAGKLQIENVNDSEQRAWRESGGKVKDAFSIFKRALELEKLQTLVVAKERRRLANGRTTTFQVLQAEQDLASIQIQKVQSQLNLIQAFNDLKSYGVEK